MGVVDRRRYSRRLLEGLRDSDLDAGILVTPLNEKGLREDVLFYEELLVYVSENNGLFQKTYVLAREIDPNKLWLLEEGHCMRSQILNLCELKKQHETEEKLHYEAGSIETLKNLVEKNFGITIVPELATYNLTASQKKRLRYFKPPTPVREISIATHRQYVKDKLIEVLKETILSLIPKEMKENKKINVLEI